uniref:Uncharacterized protein n=1 Tax=Anguilla anguilla TaxID=7936 RepID=A0A0E9XSF1_ANGAN
MTENNYVSLSKTTTHMVIETKHTCKTCTKGHLSEEYFSLYHFL